MEALPNTMPTTNGGWRVTYSPPFRSTCQTDRARRVMYAPDEATPSALACRAHEMAHGAFSPVESFDVLGETFHVEPEALKVAECLRMSLIATRSHAPMLHFMDNQEKGKAQNVAKSRDYGQALYLTLYSWGTGAEKIVQNTIRKNGPEEWRKPLSQFRRDVREILRGDASRLTGLMSYENNGVMIPDGFMISIRIARLFGNYAKNPPILRTAKENTERKNANAEQKESERALKKFQHRPEFTGKNSTYDHVRLMESDLTEKHIGKLAKRRISANKGKAPRHISRMVTDSQQRIFSRKIRAHGGVVLIDQSGSMSLEREQVMAMIHSAGGATVIGYSDLGSNLANVWVHAENGRQTTTPPVGGNGNAVDASALRFAISKQTKKGEPIIWVTDGYAYDKRGNMQRRQVEELVGLVKRHGVTMAKDSDEAIAILARSARGERPRTRITGYLKECHDDYQKREE